MKKAIIILIFCFCTSIYSQTEQINYDKIKEDLHEVINDLSNNYVYLKDKNIDLKCIRAYYEKQIPQIKTKEDITLFFEYLLDEFYDSHLILNTNTNSSFRLFSPIYATLKNGNLIISSVWLNQIENLEQNILGAEIIKVNNIDFNTIIEQFPTHCTDKNSLKAREWIANKILAGRYNKPRIVSLKLNNNKILKLDLDKLKLKSNSKLLTASIKDSIGIIRINNSLGNNNLIKEFDKSLNELANTKALILDLRNTVDGGNSYVARGIMGRFINKPKPYQKHLSNEKYDGKTVVERNWVEYVNPRKEQYKKPLIILVGRWTGSMGEGLAIGFEGMKRGEVVGVEMERLAGEINGFSFKNQSFGYRIATAKIYHINGTPREKYMPKIYIPQTRIDKDEVLDKAVELIKDKLR